MRAVRDVLYGHPVPHAVFGILLERCEDHAHCAQRFAPIVEARSALLCRHQRAILHGAQRPTALERRSAAGALGSARDRARSFERAVV